MTAGLLAAFPALSQSSCVATDEGTVCSVQQPINVGDAVSAELQRSLGLVTIDGGCSGTLLNQFWVLTARHCTTTDGRASGALLPAGSIGVTGAWAPGRTAVATALRDFAVNVGPGVMPGRDMILIYLGRENLGPVNTQPLHAVRRAPPRAGWAGTRLTTTDTVTQYGQGFGTLATYTCNPPTPTCAWPQAQAAAGAGVYRSGQFTPSSITGTGYQLAMNAATQVGHGGDSGGPTVVTVGGVGVGIAGVQSTCASTRIRGAPVPAGATLPDWLWADSIRSCSYVSVEPLVDEIQSAIRETPVCRGPAQCALWMQPALTAYLRDEL